MLVVQLVIHEFVNLGSGDKEETEVKKPAFWKRHMKEKKSTFWAIFLRENGNLEVVSLPDFTVKYVVTKFNLGKSPFLRLLIISWKML